MEYRFDWRAERVPSYEDMVFWRVSGWNDDDEAVEARDGWSMTGMVKDRAAGESGSRGRGKSCCSSYAVTVGRWPL